jgi:hypothetical protein
MAYDPGTAQLVFFGGGGGYGTPSNDTWTWNGTTWTQMSPPTSPSLEGGASMAYDPGTGQLVLFGGSNGDSFVNDSWTWNGTTWGLLNPATRPPGRTTAALAYDSGTAQLVLFGGQGNPNPDGSGPVILPLGDTWTYEFHTTPPHGYWLVGSDGGIFSFGVAQFYGSTGSLHLQRPIVGITPTGGQGGYWLVASDGGVFAFGDAGFYGSIPGRGLHPAGSGLPNSLNAPIDGVVPSADGGGYLMMASDGGLFAFGDVSFEGSCPRLPSGCSGTAVAVMPDQTGFGYWIVTASGNVYAFGDASYLGAPGNVGSPVTSAVGTPDGNGYWIVVANGTVYNFGDAVNFGSPAGQFGGLNPATAIFSTSDGAGYWVASANGTVDHYGDAPNDGGMAGTKLNGAIIAATGF